MKSPYYVPQIENLNTKATRYEQDAGVHGNSKESTWEKGANGAGFIDETEMDEAESGFHPYRLWE